MDGQRLSVAISALGAALLLAACTATPAPTTGLSTEPPPGTSATASATPEAARPSAEVPPTSSTTPAFVPAGITLLLDVSTGSFGARFDAEGRVSPPANPSSTPTPSATVPRPAVDAALSPDMTTWAWITPDNALVFQDVGNGLQRQFKLPPAGRVATDAAWYFRDIAPVWSPTGQFVRFARYVEQKKGDSEPRLQRVVFVIDSTTATLSLEASDACRSGTIVVPEWAPEADRLVVPICEPGHRMASLDVGSGRRVPLPDGQTYLLLGSGRSLVQLDAGGVALVDEAGQIMRAWTSGIVDLGSPWGTRAGAQVALRPDGPVFVSVSPRPSAFRSTPARPACEGTLLYLPNDSPDQPRCIGPRRFEAEAVGLSPDGRMLAIVERRIVDSAASSTLSSLLRVIDLITMRELLAREQPAVPNHNWHFIVRWSKDGTTVGVDTYILQ